MRKKIEFQADCIETVLGQHGIPARVTGGTVTPRWVRFQVLPAVGAKVSKIKELNEELATALDTSQCRISRTGATVIIETARNDPQPVRLLPLYEQLADSAAASPPFPLATAILGLAEDGTPLLVRLPAPNVEHILVMGKTGAGKTTLLRSIALSLAMSNKPEDLMFVFYGDGLLEVAQTIDDLGFPIHRIERMGLTAVKALLKTINKRTIHIADEVIGHENPSSVDTFARRMSHPTHHFIVALDGMPSKRLADLFNVRLVGQVNNSDGARVAIGQASTEAARLAGCGDFLCIAEGQTRRFHAAHISLEEIRESVTGMGRQNNAAPPNHQHRQPQCPACDISVIEI